MPERGFMDVRGSLLSSLAPLNQNLVRLEKFYGKSHTRPKGDGRNVSNLDILSMLL